MTERKDCYFYYESKEMNAYVPNCAYDEKYEYGFCPCNNNCKNYITKKEVYKLIKELVRCKDCKHSIIINDSLYCDRPDEFWMRLKEPDWFCADCERKDDLTES